jgi:predicted  nucleic acid-binding Zn-ribbon protein
MYSSRLNETGSSQSNETETAGNSEQGQQHHQPAVSLLEKYSNLYRNIDQVRDAYKSTTNRIRSTEQTIEELVEVDRVAMKEQTTKAVQERESILKSLEEKMDKLVTIREEESKAKLSRDLTKQKIEDAKKSSLTRRQHFEESCKDFRRKIQNLTFQSQCLGLTNLVVPSCIQAFRPQDNENQAQQYKEHIDKMNATYFTSVVTTFAELTALNGGDDGVDDHENQELQQALKQLHEYKNCIETSEKNLQQASEEKKYLLKEREKRHSQKQSLQSQYDRLQNDVQSIRSQIDSFQQQSEEARAMTAVFKKGKKTCI